MSDQSPSSRDSQWVITNFETERALRFALEYLRADDRGGVGPFTTSQWISLVIVALSIFLYRRFQRAAREGYSLQPSSAIAPPT